ncbi:heparin lyase I family protein [Polyangium aurulentum]|uniref:heparin lyase I family protein n=1 Tax=Polyangium aurulentum TaxID=2567896 RepID=UPI0010ADBD47|nr:heparin lyase I family protein [Polyangium aurulentum]UQA59820.1 polysaccharide lyase [Polyangium aurulentum]
MNAKFAMVLGAFALFGAGCGAEDLEAEDLQEDELLAGDEDVTAEAQQAVVYNPWPANPALDIDTNFENGSWSPWSTEIHGNGKIAIITDDGTTTNLPNSGDKAVKFTLTGADTYRAELKNSSSPGGRMDYDKEYWFGFAFRVEKWGQADFGMLWQLHAVPSEWGTCTSGRNPISLTMTSDGRLGLNVINNPKTTVATGGAGGVLVWSEASPITLNAWKRWVFRFKPSKGSGGIIQAWLNGAMVYERFGANVDSLDTCGVAQDPWVYAKFGIYKSYSNTNTQVVVYDDVRIDQTTGYPSAFNSVRPPGVAAK